MRASDLLAMSLGNYTRAMTRDEVAAFIRRERDLWGAVIKRMGFAPRWIKQIQRNKLHLRSVNRVMVKISE